MRVPSSSLSLVALLVACGGEFKPILDDSGGEGTAEDGGVSGDGGGEGADGGAVADGGGGSDGGQGGDGGGEQPPGGTVDYCHLQWPCSQSGSPGATSEQVYVWVYEEGLTQGEGAGPGVKVELGVGPDGGDPSAGTGWEWTAIVWSSDKDGLKAGDLANDEYAGSFTLPSSTGEYDYCGRVSLDGGSTWTFCDLAESDGNGCGGQGSTDGYLPDRAGALTVH